MHLKAIEEREATYMRAADEKIKVPFFFTLKGPLPSPASMPGKTACAHNKAPVQEASKEFRKVSGLMSRMEIPKPPPPQL